MKTLIEELEQMQSKLLQMQNTLCKMNDPMIKGHLKIKKKRGGKYEYYHAVRNEQTGARSLQYIPKSEVALPHLLAQIQYFKKVGPIIQRRLHFLNALIGDLKKHDIDQIYESMSPARQHLITPVYPTDQQRRKEWKERQFPEKSFEAGLREIYTNKEERVRSKSEKILADLFFRLDIDYKYECPLPLHDGTTVYPDFTFYNPVLNQEIYWEHFGMMDDPEYAKKTVNKLHAYEKNGITLGKRLIATFETSVAPLDNRLAAHYIQEFLL